MLSIRCECGVGHCSKAAEQLCRVAGILGVAATAVFNGREMMARPGDTPEDVLTRCGIKPVRLERAWQFMSGAEALEWLLAHGYQEVDGALVANGRLVCEAVDSAIPEWGGRRRLDGWFTARELSAIAAWMNSVKGVEVE